MAVTYVVQAGEHLSSIAADNGFENLETVWNAPENSGLRSQREDPNQLLAGDSVFIPEKRVQTFEKPIRGEHVFQVHIAKLELRLRFLDLFGGPIANTPCTLAVDGVQTPLGTDGDGVVIANVKRDARSATLSIAGDTYNLAVGALDPLPDPSGVDGRLRNLGYLDSPPDALDGDAQLASALEQFQADHALDADGTVTDAVVNALADEHGC